MRTKVALSASLAIPALVGLTLLAPDTVEAQSEPATEPFVASPLPETLMPDSIPAGMTRLPLGVSINSRAACQPPLNGLLVPTGAPGAKLDATASRRIKEIVDADQAPRRNFSELSEAERLKVGTEDRLRRVELLTLIPRATTANDFANAALVFQHGNCLEHYLLANRLAKLGRERGSRLAAWLVAATLDRALMHLGRAQKYGTQYLPTDAPGCFALYVVDPRTTDAERATHDVPALAQAIAQAREFSASSCK